jgi:N-acetylhexosamine 1-kinase
MSLIFNYLISELTFFQTKRTTTRFCNFLIFNFLKQKKPLEMPTSILSHFFPDQTCLRLTPVGEGNINDTWRAELASGDGWLLQRLNTSVFRQPDHVAANVATLAAHLHAQGAAYPLRILDPQPTAAGGGPHHVDASGGTWRVFPFFENTFAPERLPSAAHAYEAAGAYGQFLTALRDLPAEALHETIVGFHDTPRRFEVFEEVLHRDPMGRRAECQRDIGEVLETRFFSEKINELRLPRRATHNDTKAGNVLLDRSTGQAVAVIDWDTAMPGSVLSDFGDMVRTFVSDRYEDDPDWAHLRVRDEVLAALTEGFLGTTAGLLTPTEREHLLLGAHWIVGEQALRFLSDYVAGDVYYKTAYPTHNLVRARNQLALLRGVLRG